VVEVCLWVELVNLFDRVRKFIEFGLPKGPKSINEVLTILIWSYIEEL
jgi:hypothetical protein